MNKILVIVHLEPDFEQTAGDLSKLVDKVVQFSKRFDSVINITSAEGLSGTKPFPKLADFSSHEWIWGFDADYYIQEEPDKWIEGENYIATGGHDYSEILDWMKELPKDAKYTLVGGGRNECLRDIYDIWCHLNYEVTIKENLTY